MARHCRERLLYPEDHGIILRIRVVKYHFRASWMAHPITSMKAIMISILYDTNRSEFLTGPGTQTSHMKKY